MIIGFAGSHIGLLYPQTVTLRSLFRMKMSAFVHRGRGNIDTIAHNMVRGMNWKLPIDVLPMIDEHSVIGTVRNDDPFTTVWGRRERGDVNRIISIVADGIVFVPKSEHEEQADGWDLVHTASERGVPVLTVWPDGKMTIKRNEV